MAFRKEYPAVSVVVPLFNEADCLRTNIALIGKHLNTLQLPHEIVLVDDGSTDATEAICQDIVNQNSFVRLKSCPVNCGKGFAVKTGVLDAVGEYIMFTDADLAVPIRFIGACLKQLRGGFPVVIGSRHLSESFFKVREGPLRQFLGEVFRQFAKVSLGLRVSDITCGFKGFHKKAAFDIFSRSKIDRWGYDAEIMFLAKKLGYKIAEVPVQWQHSFDSKVRVGSACFGTIMEMFQIRYYHLSNGYGLWGDGKRRI
jgi:glycosyltransferase involved in cell wall biosynthesis